MLGVFNEIKDEVKNTVKSAYDSLPGYRSIPGYNALESGYNTIQSGYNSIPSIGSILDFWGFNKKNKNLTKDIVKIGGRLTPRPSPVKNE
jgi:hypothetical protein